MEKDKTSPELAYSRSCWPFRIICKFNESQPCWLYVLQNSNPRAHCPAGNQELAKAPRVPRSQILETVDVNCSSPPELLQVLESCFPWSSRTRPNPEHVGWFWAWLFNNPRTVELTDCSRTLESDDLSRSSHSVVGGRGGGSLRAQIRWTACES